MTDFSVFNTVLVALPVLLLHGPATRNGTAADRNARQALVVTTANWDTPLAVLRQYERRDYASPWAPAGGVMKAVVGRHGMGWGRGVHPETPLCGPKKREGDGKAPAGLFPLDVSFGYADTESVRWIRLPYRQVTTGIKCIDDPGSIHYNRIIDVSSVNPDWKSHEDMLRNDDQYRFGVVIGHNAHPACAGGGSCIFLHIWKESTEGTAGCTAVSAEHMESLLHWLNPESRPVLIQMPETEYERLRQVWDLP